MARGGTMWAVLLLVAALAGCVEDEGSSNAASATTPASGTTLPDPDEDVPELPLLDPAREVTLYFTADGGLVPEVPAAGHITQGEFFVDYIQGSFDVDRYTLLSAPLANATYMHAQPVTLTIWAESDTPHPPMAGLDQVGGVGFVGSSMGMPLFAFALSDPVFLPGEPVRYDVTLEFGAMAPVVVPKGERLAVFAGLAATTSDQAPARILVGGAHASSVTFTISNMTKDPLADLDAAGTEVLTGLVEKPEDPKPEHAITVLEDATELRIQIDLAGGNAADFDIDLYDGTTQLAGSHTPATYESIYLMGPALDGLHGKELKVTVGHFYPVNAEYELTVTQR